MRKPPTNLPIMAVSVMLLVATLPVTEAAAPISLTKAGGAISFTFGGGWVSAMTAAETLEAQGMRGTFYVVSTHLRQEPWYTAFLSASEVASLATRGHEIGSMTATGVDLTSLSAANLNAELANSQDALQTITGRPVRQLAYPYGAVNAAVAAAAEARYSSGRIISWSAADFTGSVDPYLLPGFIMRQSTSLSEAKWIVDYAAQNNVYVVLSFEKIVTNPGTYDWTPADLASLAAYVSSKGVAVPTVSEILGGTPPPNPTVPAAPVFAAPAVGNAQVDLSWSVPANGGSPLTGYVLYRAAGGSAESLYRTISTQPTFRDVNVTNGVSYTYRVGAINAIGEGPRSNAVQASPQAGPPAGRGTIVFTFDDGSNTHIAAGQTLANKGMRGTFYIISDCTRSEADTDRCMTQQQVQSLAQAGHDIESHTVRHRDLASLGTKQLRSELVNSQATLQTLIGKPVRHLAYPYGSHDPTVRAETAKSYATGRIFLSDPAVSNLPTLLAQSGTDPMVVPGIGVNKATSLTKAEQYIDYAVANDRTLVLVFHDLLNSGGDAYSWTPANFDALVDHAAATGVSVKTMAQVYG